MRELMQALIQFQAKMGQPIGEWPSSRLPKERAWLRRELISEEFNELWSALRRESLIETADAMCDLIYVVVGTAVEMGIDLAPLWEEVHRTNMAKAGGPVRADGKRLKPEGWMPPDIVGILGDQMCLQSCYDCEVDS